MDLGLKGKRALVLGGNRGIGLGIARALAREDADVSIAARDETRLATALEVLRSIGAGRKASFSLDLSDVVGIRVFARRVEREFGPIDVLVNNTGGPGYGGVSQRGPAEWRGKFEEMVLSVIELSDALVPGMRERRWGRVLTVVSSGVVQPIPILGVSNTLRNALVSWSKTLANEVAGDGVTVNILVPGRIDTERVRATDEAIAAKEKIPIEEARRRSAATIPVGRYGTVEEFGAVAAFAASVPASYVTGSMLRCDGGIVRGL
jgi:3-oxoacyl-[acyl-carrier protein] reductase